MVQAVQHIHDQGLVALLQDSQSEWQATSYRTQPGTPPDRLPLEPSCPPSRAATPDNHITQQSPPSHPPAPDSHLASRQLPSLSGHHPIHPPTSSTHESRPIHPTLPLSTALPGPAISKHTHDCVPIPLRCPRSHFNRPPSPVSISPPTSAQPTSLSAPKAAQTLPPRPHTPNPGHPLHGRPQLRHLMLHLLTVREAQIFLLMALWMGMGVGVIDTFIFLHISHLGGSEFLMGLMLTVTCVAEIPSFHFQPWFLKAIGLEGMLHVVLAAFVLRLTGYALLPWLPSVWLVLPIELLHGVTFAWAWGCGAIKCQELAPEGWGTTMQGVFQGVYFGLGQGFGALVGGGVSSLVGVQGMFAVMAGVIASGWGLCALLEWWWGVGGWRRGGAGKYSRLADREEQCGAHERFN